ncbi:MAG: triphosphoribosyl-dephospho-CoA synthase [Planctomycetota bacterium]
MESSSDLIDAIEICCLIEATARKPGNVHPCAAFDDLSYDDFVQAASASAKPLANSRSGSLGMAILQAVEATQSVTRSNVNLGIALLIAPLACVPADSPLESGIGVILARTSIQDAADTFAAILAAKPGGLGKTTSQDVHDQPTVTLREAMVLAADRDRIAQQYATDFAGLLGRDRRWLVEEWTSAHEQVGRLNSNWRCDDPVFSECLTAWEVAVIRFQMRLLATTPDSLVVRKCGQAIAVELQHRAVAVAESDWPGEPSGWSLLLQFDQWLRADGHRRNPGTTADFVAAALFAAVRDDLIQIPSREEVVQHAARIQQFPGKTV